MPLLATLCVCEKVEYGFGGNPKRVTLDIFGGNEKVKHGGLKCSLVSRDPAS